MALKFCSIIDLPSPVFQKIYDLIIKTIHEAIEIVSSFSMKSAQEEKRISVDKSEKNGITISGDGSWRKRGFSSHYGIVSLIGWYTGKVVDVVIKSKFCKACSLWKNKEETVEFKEWRENHETMCDANHERSARKMEIDGAREMFSRANEKNGITYSNYIGDGDCKTFKAVVEQNPSVYKEKCIDHVQKRMGSRLQNIAKIKKLSDKGKLTGKIIDELAIYYGLTIRRHCHSIEEMKKAIWAMFYHKISTDDEPHHHLCPEGPESCIWQLQKAIGGDESSFKHGPAMPKEIFEAMKKTYEELNSDELLTRCLGGFTQNSNESFNAMVWTIASNGKTVLDITVNLAVIYFNDGYKGIMQVMN